MKPKDFAKLMDRDGGCLHCGETEAVAPNHRINRGMGGSRRLDKPSNLVVLCSVVNGLIESQAQWQALAREWGWKLQRWQKPEEQPVFDSMAGRWYYLDNSWGKTTDL